MLARIWDTFHTKVPMKKACLRHMESPKHKCLSLVHYPYNMLVISVPDPFIFQMEDDAHTKNNQIYLHPLKSHSPANIFLCIGNSQSTRKTLIGSCQVAFPICLLSPINPYAPIFIGHLGHPAPRTNVKHQVP